MPEVFGIQIEATIVAKNVKEIEKDMRNRFKDIDADISTKVPNTLKDAGKDMGKSISEALGGVGGAAGGIGGKVGGMIGGAGALGPLAAGGAIIGTMVTVLKMINDNVEQMRKKLEEASPAFKGTKEILDRMYGMVLKPIGDIMSILMRPYLILMMQRLKLAMTKEGGIKDIMGEMKAGRISPESAAEKIQEIVKPMLQDFAILTQAMNKSIGPIAGSIAGFQAGLDFIFNSWFVSAGAWLQGVAEAFESSSTGFSADMLETVALAKEAGLIIPEEVAKIIDSQKAKEEFERTMKEMWGVLKDHFTDTLIPWADKKTKAVFGAILDTIASVAQSIFYAAVRSLPAGEIYQLLIDPAKEAAGKYIQEEGEVLDDFIMRPGQGAIKFSPQDTIMGFKGGGMPGGIPQSNEITVHVHVSRDIEMGKEMGEIIADEMRKDLRKMNTYGSR